MKNAKTLIVAILSGICGLAGTLATVLPDGEVQKGAAKVANVCEANGFRAYPEVATPHSGEDAGTIPSPTLPPSLEAPAPVGEQRAQLGLPEARGAWRGLNREWAWLPAAEAWPGESRGWAPAASWA